MKKITTNSIIYLRQRFPDKSPSIHLYTTKSVAIEVQPTTYLERLNVLLVNAESKHLHWSIHTNELEWKEFKRRLHELVLRKI